MWFMFRDKEQFQRLQDAEHKLNGTLFFSKKFVDYWKKKPYRIDEGE